MQDSALEEMGMARIQGDDGANALNGGVGDDLLFGAGNADTLNGGAGNDVLYGYGQGAAPGSLPISATRIASGLDRPVFMLQAPDDSTRAFILEAHTGRVRILDLATGVLSPTPFLDIGALVSKGQEQGLLGLAFHPDFATNGLFYVNYTDTGGDTRIVEYRVGSNPNVVDTTTARQLLFVDQPFANHNGGWMDFGPDGYLYIALGDGGSGGDPGTARKTSTACSARSCASTWTPHRPGAPTGSRRATPSRTGLAPMRSGPMGCGIRGDRVSTPFWAISGSRMWDRERARRSTCSSRSRWRHQLWMALVRGQLPFRSGAPTSGLTFPIHEYNHDETGGFSVTGGYVFRGGVAGLEGEYFFADFVSNRIWSLIEDNGALVRVVDRTAAITANLGDIDDIASFAQDRAGNLYIVGLDGEIHRLGVVENRSDAGNRFDGGEGLDRAYGGTGDDLFLGGPGADTFDGGEGFDTVSFAATANRVVINLFTGQGFENDAAGDRYVSIEGVVGSLGSDVVVGTATANRLELLDGADLAFGNAGADTMLGGIGPDTLYGEDGNDDLDGGFGQDVLWGGLGDDALQGGRDNDILLGDAGDDTLRGGDELDTLYGWTGRDILLGDAGNDTLFGEQDDDILYGWLGADLLWGGDGNDTLWGEQDNDTLLGETGDDVLLGHRRR